MAQWCTLVLTPEHDDPTLGADPNRNNDFSYSDDMEGLKCPFSAHMRRVNPRDALKNDLVAVNLHLFLRRGTNYGPPLPEGVLEDDGVQRGGVFLLIGAYIKRQFEFVQSQWITDGDFIRHGTEQDPILENVRVTEYLPFLNAHWLVQLINRYIRNTNISATF
jgi:deferrochelatase/peroxidase EfeB